MSLSQIKTLFTPEIFAASSATELQSLPATRISTVSPISLAAVIAFLTESLILLLSCSAINNVVIK